MILQALVADVLGIVRGWRSVGNTWRTESILGEETSKD
jgi:hypothetical protein